MKKKVLSMLMAVSIIVGTLAGCGNPERVKSEPLDSDLGETKEVGDEEPYEVVMAYPYIGATPQDLEKVEDVLSKITLEKFNATLKFKPISFMDMAQEYNLWASSGEKVDLILLWDLRLSDYVNSGKIISLENLMEYAPAINKAAESYSFLKGGQYNGEQYAVPIIQLAIGDGWGLCLPVETLNAIEVEEKELYDYEDLDAIFAQVHQMYPDLVVLDICGALSVTVADHFIMYDDLDCAGAVGGVLMNAGMDDTTIVNLFETEEYKEYVTWMRKWNQDGYISQDAATTTESPTEWMNAGRTATFGWGYVTPEWSDTVSVQFGKEMTVLPTKGLHSQTSTFSELRWAVSSNSENPQKAIQVLDLLYDGEEFVNLLQNGIEGEHYVMTEEEKIIDFPEGLDALTSPYYYNLGLYGDKRNVYAYTPSTASVYAEAEKQTEKALKNSSKVMGYSFDSSSVTTELTAISNVTAQYLPVLEYGMADVDETLAAFNQALKDAGIEKVIAENQRQLDEWLAKQ